MPEHLSVVSTGAPDLSHTSESEEMYLITVARAVESGQAEPIPMAAISDSMQVSVAPANEMVREPTMDPPGSPIPPRDSVGIEYPSPMGPDRLGLDHAAEIGEITAPRAVRDFLDGEGIGVRPSNPPRNGPDGC